MMAQLSSLSCHASPLPPLSCFRRHNTQQLPSGGPSHWSPCELLIEFEVGGEEVSALSSVCIQACVITQSGAGREEHILVTEVT